MMTVYWISNMLTIIIIAMQWSLAALSVSGYNIIVGLTHSVHKDLLVLISVQYSWVQVEGNLCTEYNTSRIIFQHWISHLLQVLWHIILLSFVYSCIGPQPSSCTKASGGGGVFEKFTMNRYLYMHGTLWATSTCTCNILQLVILLWVMCAQLSVSSHINEIVIS